jgi:hypothetical protein
MAMLVITICYPMFPIFGDPLWSKTRKNASSEMSPSSFLSLMVSIVLQVKAEIFNDCSMRSQAPPTTTVVWEK